MIRPGDQWAVGLPGLPAPDAAHEPSRLADERVVAAAVEHPVEDRREDHGQDGGEEQRGQPADPVGRVELEGDHDDHDLGSHAEQHRAPPAERDDADQQQRPQHRADDRDQHHQAERVEDVGAGHPRHQPQGHGQHDEGDQGAAQDRPGAPQDARPAEQLAQVGPPAPRLRNRQRIVRAESHDQTIAQAMGRGARTSPTSHPRDAAGNPNSG
jgi:hypothetical protein